MIKTCYRCGLTLGIDSFYTHKKMADGRLNKCKECCKQEAIENRNLKIEYYRKKDRERSLLDHRVKARVAYAKTEQGRKRLSISKKAWMGRNPNKRKAHIKLGNSVRDGKIKKKPCAVCGSCKVHAHHDDYSKPLEVIWLCQKHHRDIHK